MSTSERPSPPNRSDFNLWTAEKLRNMDTDQFGHVNNAAVSTFLEAGRMEIFAADAARAELGSLALAVVRLEIDFHREIFYPGKVEVGSRILSVGRTSFQVKQGVFNADACAVSALATCVLFDAAAKRSAPVSPALRAYLLAPAAA
jgi:acyl-CoA thioester hydrolase